MDDAVGSAAMFVGYCSPGMRRLPHLDQFLDAPCQFFWRRPGRAVTHIAGWGLKKPAARARHAAAKSGLPYISLEDGFLRSHGLGVDGAPLHSLVVDYSGIYYDARRPSDLEQLIAEAKYSQPELARATSCMELLRRYRLSKYNCGADRPLEWPDDRLRVLVVDQTFGDAAVRFGGADAQTFREMLDAAIADNPDAEVCVKVHPDVIAGKKRGYLLDLARERGCRILAEELSPWAVLDAVEQVYVVTSQMGFDALLAGKVVHCFGQPFYAGWGLTRDRQQCERRGQPRSLEQVFCAAYLHYCRYLNPYTGQRCELEDTIALIAEQKRQRERMDADWLALDFSPWKRSFLPAFLGGCQTIRFAGSDNSAIWKRARPERILAWASALSPGLIARCADRALPLWRVEDGFLRSVGLGADLVSPLSLAFDSQGIYYDATGPSDLEQLLAQATLDEFQLARARSLRERLVHAGLTKYNVGRSPVLEIKARPGQKVILVPGQVETDASIAHGSPVYKTNRALLAAARKAEPEAFIVYKPHPDVLAGGRLGELGDAMESLADLVVTDAALPELLGHVDELHTLCSLSGFEALLRGVSVVTYGLPFYAGWGLTRDQLLEHPELLPADFDLAAFRARRWRQLGLDELVAGVLLQYPVYVDPCTGDRVNAETAVAVLEMQKATRRRGAWWRPLYRLMRKQFLRR